MISLLFSSPLPDAERGGQINIVRLVEGLPAPEFHCSLLTPKEGSLAVRARAAGAEVHLAAVPELHFRKRSVLRQAWIEVRTIELRRQLVRHSFDVIYVDAVQQLAAAARLAKAHSAKVLWHAQNAVPTRYDRDALEAADVVVLASAGVEARLRGLTGRARQVRIVNGVDTSRFRPGRSSDLRQSLGLAPDTPIVSYVGGVVASKGVRDVVIAFARVAQRFERARLWMVGPEEEGTIGALAPLLDELGIASRVAWLGARADVARVLQETDVFLFASPMEGGNPLAILEAMASEVPCAAYDIPSVREILGRGGGLLSPVGNVDALAEALALLLGDDERRQREGKAARQIVTEHHSLSTFIAAFAELFRTLRRESGP